MFIMSKNPSIGSFLRSADIVTVILMSLLLFGGCSGNANENDHTRPSVPHTGFGGAIDAGGDADSDGGDGEGGDNNDADSGVSDAGRDTEGSDDGGADIGISDAGNDANDTNAPHVNIEFDDGYFILGGVLNQPVRAVLTIVTHIMVLPDGRFVMAGAQGLVDHEQVEDTSRDARFITVNATESGWTIFATGLVSLTEDGDRYVETDLFDVVIPVLGGQLTLALSNAQFVADIVKDLDGNESIVGTLTYEKSVMEDNEFDGDEIEFLGDFVAPQHIPVGAPHLCEDICGDVTGVCDPPADLPDPDFCSD